MKGETDFSHCFPDAYLISYLCIGTSKRDCPLFMDTFCGIHFLPDIATYPLPPYFTRGSEKRTPPAVVDLSAHRWQQRRW